MSLNHSTATRPCTLPFAYNTTSSTNGITRVREAKDDAIMPEKMAAYHWTSATTFGKFVAMETVKGLYDKGCLLSSLPGLGFMEVIYRFLLGQRRWFGS